MKIQSVLMNISTNGQVGYRGIGVPLKLLGVCVFDEEVHLELYASKVELGPREKTPV